MLLNFSENEQENLFRPQVICVSPVITYFLYEERPQSSSYHVQNCLHIDFESAKLGAEEKRKQGSNFGIAEVPSISIRTNDGIVILTQINISPRNPFQHYSRLLKVISEGKSVYIDSFSYKSLGLILETFEIYSQHWDKPEERYNPVKYPKGLLMYATTDNFVPLRPIGGELHVWKSMHFGSSRDLSWAEDEWGTYCSSGTLNLFGNNIREKRI